MKTATKIETRMLKYFFTPDEKRDFSDEAMSIKNDVEALKKEAASVAATYKAKIGEKEARERLLRNKYTEGFENRESYVFALKDYQTRTISYINPETGEILETAEFTPRDEVKQLDIASEEISKQVQNTTFSEKAFNFFNSVRSELEDKKEEPLIRSELEGNRILFIARLISFSNKNGLLEVSSPVSFNEAFDTIEPIFQKWIGNLYGDSETEETKEPVLFSVNVAYAKRAVEFSEIEDSETLVYIKAEVLEVFSIPEEDAKTFGFKHAGKWVNINRTIGSFVVNNYTLDLEMLRDCPREALEALPDPVESEVQPTKENGQIIEEPTAGNMVDVATLGQEIAPAEPEEEKPVVQPKKPKAGKNQPGVNEDLQNSLKAENDKDKPKKGGKK